MNLNCKTAIICQHFERNLHYCLEKRQAKHRKAGHTQWKEKPRLCKVNLYICHVSILLYFQLCTSDGTDTKLRWYHTLQLLHCTVTSLECDVLQTQRICVSAVPLSAFTSVIVCGNTLFRALYNIYLVTFSWKTNSSGSIPSPNTDDAKAGAKIPQLHNDCWSCTAGCLVIKWDSFGWSNQENVCCAVQFILLIRLSYQHSSLLTSIQWFLFVFSTCTNCFCGVPTTPPCTKDWKGRQDCNPSPWVAVTHEPRCEQRKTAGESSTQHFSYDFPRTIPRYPNRTACWWWHVINY